MAALGEHRTTLDPHWFSASKLWRTVGTLGQMPSCCVALDGRSWFNSLKFTLIGLGGPRFVLVWFALIQSRIKYVFLGRNWSDLVGSSRSWSNNKRGLTQISRLGLGAQSIRCRDAAVVLFPFFLCPSALLFRDFYNIGVNGFTIGWLKSSPRRLGQHARRSWRTADMGDCGGVLPGQMGRKMLKGKGFT
jgi:hypothetical protein